MYQTRIPGGRAAAGQGSKGACGYCTMRRRKTHRTEDREVFYPWYPWSGCVVQLHEVVEKSSRDCARCSRGCDASVGWLERPLWMFDRAECTPMWVETFPRANLAALIALTALLAEPRRRGCGCGRLCLRMHHRTAGPRHRRQPCASGRQRYPPSRPAT
jgi:hypothetical protein